VPTSGGLGSESCTSTAAPAPEFSAFAEKHREDYLFGIVTDADLTAAAGVTAPAIVLYRSFDAPRTEYPYPVADAKSKDFEDWIGQLAIPVIDEVNADNYGTYATSGKPLAYLFIIPEPEEAKDNWVSTIKPVAEKYHDKVNFVWIDAAKYGEHGKALNLEEVKWPSFVIQDLEGQLKFPLDQSKDITTEVLGEFLEAYVAGKLEPSFKSQPLPETQDGPVQVVVGKNFEEVVFDDSKDVFVEFYASWCGHCKRLAPIWDNLGEHFASVSDQVTIAKLEAPENDLPPSLPFRVTGFPTLKFKPAGGRDFVDYEGDRSLESLIAFVEEHSKNEFTVVAPKKVETETEAQVPVAEKAPEPAATPAAEAAHDEL